MLILAKFKHFISIKKLFRQIDKKFAIVFANGPLTIYSRSA
jgi:hypothetical protein